MDRTDQKMLGNLLFWLEWVFPHITPFIQAHTCRSHGFIWNWLQLPVFTEPTFVPSTTSSKVNTTPLATITAQVWHWNHFRPWQLLQNLSVREFHLQGTATSLSKITAGRDPCKIPSLFCIPLNHHPASSKAGAPSRSLRHHPRLLRGHSGGEEPVQHDHYLGKKWKEEIRGWLRKIISTFGLGPSPVLGRLGHLHRFFSIICVRTRLQQFYSSWTMLNYIPWGSIWGHNSQTHFSMC